MENKSVIQKVVDLLEENGFYVFKAEREAPTDFSSSVSKAFGTIALRIAPKGDEKC